MSTWIAQARICPKQMRRDPMRKGLTVKRRRIASRPLTVKLRGRTTTPDKRRGRTLSPGARGAKPFTHLGPLQRLLDGEGSAKTVSRATT